MTSAHRRMTHGARAVLAGALLLWVAAPARAELPDTDKKTLADLALAWAIGGGIADWKLVKDPSTVVVADTHLPRTVQLDVPKRTVRVLTPAAIQAEADRLGDFLYFRFDRFDGDKHHASVSIALVWAVSKNSTVHYLSGGGATLEFERRGATWVLLPVSEQWMSGWGKDVMRKT